MNSLVSTALEEFKYIALSRETVFVTVLLVLGVFSLGASVKDMRRSVKDELLEFIRVNLLVSAVFVVEFVATWTVLTVTALLR